MYDVLRVSVSRSEFSWQKGCKLSDFHILTGSYFLATYVAGTLFDREAQKFKHGRCKGPACFRLAFLIIAGFSAVAFVLSIVLHRRTRPLYRRVVEDTIAERKRRGREVKFDSQKGVTLPQCIQISYF